MLVRRSALMAIPVGALATVAYGATPDSQVRESYAAWDAAFGKQDAKLLASFYTADALFMPPSHDLIRGPEGVEKFFAGLFSAGVTAHKLELIQANGDGGQVTAAAKWSAQSKNGPVGGLAVHEFEGQGGAYKIRLHTFN